MEIFFYASLSEMFNKLRCPFFGNPFFPNMKRTFEEVDSPLAGRVASFWHRSLVHTGVCLNKKYLIHQTDYKGIIEIEEIKRVYLYTPNIEIEYHELLV